MRGLGGALERFDRLQQERAWLGLPLAVGQKHSDDQGGYLAATITYYVFFSLFPLLLVFVTGLGYVLHDHPRLENSIVDSTLSQFPVIGPQLKVNALTGNAIALGLGIVGALWGGMGGVIAVEHAFNQVWGVPMKRRPSFVAVRLRALLTLFAFGAAIIVSTALSGAGSLGGSYNVAFKVGALALSVLVNLGLFLLAFRVLTAAKPTWHELLPGAALAAALWTLLQALGGVYVNHVLRSSSNTYGTFALVIGLLSWIYLTARITLLAAETNVVLARRLWPRSFSAVVEQPRTGADEESLRQRAKVEERREDQEVDVGFGDRAAGCAPPPTASSAVRPSRAAAERARTLADRQLYDSRASGLRRLPVGRSGRCRGGALLRFCARPGHRPWQPTEAAPATSRCPRRRPLRREWRRWSYQT